MPPEDFDPPFAIDSGCNGVNGDQFLFRVRKQMTSHLCMRTPSGGTNSTSPIGDSPGAAGVGAGAPGAAQGSSSSPSPGGFVGGRCGGTPRAGQGAGGDEFGFTYVDRPLSFREFAAAADWIKERHFRDPVPRVRTVVGTRLCVCASACT